MARGGDSDADERVLSPDELDIEAREEVASIGGDRYVIGPDGPPDAPDDADAATDTDGTAESDDADGDSDAADDGDSDDAPEAGSTDSAVDITGRDVKRWLDDELATQHTTYAHRIAAKSGDEVAHQQLATDDVSTAFEGLLVWYAQQLADDTPVDEALGILLAESTVRVKYPTARLVAYLEEHDLGPEDPIRELLETVSEGDGLVFPPNSQGSSDGSTTSE